MVQCYFTMLWDHCLEVILTIFEPKNYWCWYSLVPNGMFQKEAVFDKMHMDYIYTELKLSKLRSYSIVKSSLSAEVWMVS